MHRNFQNRGLKETIPLYSLFVSGICHSDEKLVTIPCSRFLEKTLIVSHEFTTNLTVSLNDIWGEHEIDYILFVRKSCT